MKHLTAIDGLRAVAVLSVVAYHAGLPVPAGFVGVDVFFAISGYVITRMLAREREDTGRIDFAAFYARRVRRILPALVVMVCVTLAVSAALLPPIAAGQVAHSAVAALAVTANLHFLNSTGGYFDTASGEMPLLHTWSLSVEEQFYFLWPMVLLLNRRWLIVGLTVASLLLADGLRHLDASQAFFQMPARFWEMGVGGCIALSQPRALKWLAPAGLAVLAMAIAYPLPMFPGIGALPAVLGAGAVLVAVHGGTSVRVLEHPVMRAIGLGSYSLYLWHWPVLVLYRLTHLEPATLPVSIALCSGAGVLAWLSYRFVETPFRGHWQSKRRVISGGVAACLLVIMAAGPIGRRADATALDNATFFRGTTDAPSVALIGDSHAMAWVPLAGAIAHKEGRGLKVWTAIICPPALGYAMSVQKAQYPDAQQHCLNINDDAARTIAAGHYDTVILAARWLPLFHQMPRGLDSPYPTDPASITAVERGLTRMVDTISPHARRILIMGPLPQLSANPDRCIASGEPWACAMPRAEFERLAQAPRAFFATLAARHSNVHVVDPKMCDAAHCPVQVTMYRDDDHISTQTAQAFAREWIAGE